MWIDAVVVNSSPLITLFRSGQADLLPRLFQRVVVPDAEFDEYVESAVECRRRVKEQMNRRKPDDEFARINLSYHRADGSEVVLFRPESKAAAATQQPFRRKLGLDIGRGRLARDG